MISVIAFVGDGGGGSEAVDEFVRMGDIVFLESRTGLPRASPAAWILVLSPLGSGLGPGHAAPFFAARPSRLLMRPHDG
jgi:hypothetical protein